MLPARQARLRRALRPMPLEQAAEPAGRPRSGERERTRLSDRVERVLGLDQDRGVQGGDAQARARRAISSRATSCRPSCACRSRCSASTPAARWRPTRFATTSGTTSRPSPTRRCRRSARSRFVIRSPARRSDYPLPAGGRGYIRPASLVSLWSTAPFLQNNTVGPFDTEPVGGRADAGRSTTRSSRCCGPSEREKDPIFEDEKGPGVGVIDRMTVDSYLEVPEGYIPETYGGLVSLSRRLLPFIGGSGCSVKIGPVPERHAGRLDGEHGSARLGSDAGRARRAPEEAAHAVERTRRRR